MLPLIAFTCGDPSGIGPEVAVKAMRDVRVRRVCRPLAVGPQAVFEQMGWRSSLTPLIDPGTRGQARLGRPSVAGGAASYAAVLLAVRMARRGLIDALVTAPVSKEAWSLAGAPQLDHTQVIQEETGARRVAMMLLGGGMRAVLATRHIPHGDVSKRLTSAAIGEAALLAREGLKALGVRRPSLALCGLNPHAGDNGLIGREELRVLRPAAKRWKLAGPRPADALWSAHRKGSYDCLIAAYHDQALIPLKVAAGTSIVNWTLGAPLLRTSPGHGTAYDIAGKGKADPSGMIEAVLLAARLA